MIVILILYSRVDKSKNKKRRGKGRDKVPEYFKDLPFVEVPVGYFT